ncbi:MAG: hypothetical protein WD407_12480 [Rhodospirillales bacterium]
MIVTFGVLYPALVYIGLTVFSPTVVIFFVLVFALFQGFIKGRSPINTATRVGALVAGVCVLIVGIIDQNLAAKIYPMVVNAALACLFGYSLIAPPTVIEKIARLREPLLSEGAVAYTRTVTIVWLIFFVANGTMAAVTAVFMSTEIWALYNGLIAYVLIAVLFLGERCIRSLVLGRSA